MSWVNSDRTQEEDPVSMLRGALIDEIGATDLYDKLIRLIPNYKDKLTEIRNDELNHQGILIGLMLDLAPSQATLFEKGLNGEEAVK